MGLRCKIIFLGLLVFLSMAVSMSTTTMNESEGDQPQGYNYNETQFEIFLEEFNRMAMNVYYFAKEKSWIYNTNITEYNRQWLIQSNLEVARFSTAMRQRALAYNGTNFSETNQRHLSTLLYLGNAALKNKTEFKEGADVVSRMKGRYSTGQACDEAGMCYNLDPDLNRLMATSRNYSELLWAWDAWRAAVGPANREDFARYVVLKNKVAVANDEPNTAAYWQSAYGMSGDENFPNAVEELFQQVKPLYEQLHAFVRRKLYGIYGPDFIDLKGPIPAHILGNMWSQTWNNLYDLCEPFPNKTRVDVTKSMIEQNYTVTKMFQMANEFFTSLGLISVPPSFWTKSMFVRPTDGRRVNCHPSAWDFNNQRDFRIKMCTSITMGNFITIHHELGHVQYYLQYKDQHVHFRGGANPAFHEAVGDVMSLSVSTPKHLHTVGLLDILEEDDEADLNHLMKIALTKIAFLPFGYLVDQWRWRVFNGTTPTSRYNEDWWKLRLKYQGIVPPNERTEEDFDPAAKYHISAGVPYIRYFVSFILQFQFHEALCNAAGHVGPLHRCDIYRSEEAGNLLSNMLRKGSSEPWDVALEAITGTKKISATSLMSYFQPLVEYLKQENKENGETIGWGDSPADPEPEGGGALRNTPGITLVILTAFLWTILCPTW